MTSFKSINIVFEVGKYQTELIPQPFRLGIEKQIPVHLGRIQELVPSLVLDLILIMIITKPFWIYLYICITF